MLSPDATVRVLDQESDEYRAFYGLLSSRWSLQFHESLQGLLEEQESRRAEAVLLDVGTLRHASQDLLGRVRSLKAAQHPIGLLTSAELESIIEDLRRVGIYQVGAKTNDATAGEVGQLLRCITSPTSVFGLANHLDEGSQVLRADVRNIEEKNRAIEDVINHFATTGFEIHELYNVRLILEEALTNALFHAFRDEFGREKYSISSFQQLLQAESVAVEYGASEVRAGFTITDNAGTLTLRRIVDRLERQFGNAGLFDENGRGLYLTHCLSSALVINVEEWRRTQIVALFDEPQYKRSGPKTFLLNFVTADGLSDCILDPDLD